MAEATVKKINPVHEDDRGIIIDILAGDMKHVGLITQKQGAVRAKHYHKIQWQYTYMLKGKIELVTKDSNDESAQATTTIMQAGDLASIPPQVIHKYTALEDSEFIAITSEMRVEDGYEKDTYRVDI